MLPLDEEKFWDAIIIGGGPAGSTVARYAAEGGLSVLVTMQETPLERRCNAESWSPPMRR